MADDVRIDIVAVDKTRAAVDSAKRNMQGLEQAAQRANQTFAQVGRTAAGVFGGMAAFAAANGVANAFVGIGKTAFDAYAQSERLRQSLQAMSAKEIMQSGGATNMAKALQMAGGRAKELQGWIERMAVQSPFNQQDVAAALRMGMAYGFNSREAQRLTQIMLDYSAATGQSGETMQRVALALGQIRARGKLAGQEINQLTEAGINVRQILADAFGKTTAEITAMSEKGLISANDAIQAITNSLETDFKGAAAASATSMAGLVATFEDIAQLRLRDLFAGVFESAQPYIIDIADTLSAPEFAAGVTALGAGIGKFSAEQLGGAADTIQRIADAISPLLGQESPAWLVGLTSLVAMNNSDVKIKVTPEITSFTFADGKVATIDVNAKIITIDPPGEEEPTIRFVADWQKGTLGSLIAAVADPFNGFNILLNANWKPETLGQMWSQAASVFGVGFPVSFTVTAIALTDLWNRAQEYFNDPVMVSASWNDGTLSGLFDGLQAWFVEPIMIFGDWGSDQLTALWNSVQSVFSANPITILTGTAGSPEVTQARAQINSNMADLGLVTNQSPQRQPGSGVSTRAAGSGFFAGGLALVGEVGPELVSLPRGTQVLRSHDTRQILGKVPAFAEGNTPLGNALQSLLKSMGLWRKVPEPTNMYGVQGAEVMAKAAGKAWGEAAKNTENAFADAAKASTEATTKAVESMLQGVPGLFGASSVTGDQMRQAEAGIPQNFADNYLRRLSDEVLNGVDWEGVDIKDAANRAGIDPNLPANMILELFRAAWDDSSLFSNPENLDLIDTGAVQDFIAKQQAQALGKANVLAYFGDPDVANTALGSLASAIGSAANTEDNAAALRDAGYAGAAVYYSGWTSYMNGAPIVPPGTAPTGTGTGVPPAKAVGVGYWTGGPMRVHRDETVYLPRGASVVTAAESQRSGGGGGNVVINAQVSSNIDVEALTNQIARRLRARMN